MTAHESVGPQIIIASGILTGLAGLFLALRLYCKYLNGRGLWWDDHFLIAAYIMAIVNLVLFSMAVELGFGHHVVDIELPDLLRIALIVQIYTIFGTLAIAWSKTSFALTLLRITNGKMKVFIWFVIVTMNMFSMIGLVLLWVKCTPIEKSWNPLLPGECISPSIPVNFTIFSSVYSGAMDILLALLPWKLLAGLQMKKKEKIGVALAMSMGIVAGSTAFVKSAKVGVITDLDFTFTGASLIIWSVAESTVTIIASSLPVLRVLLREARSSARRRYATMDKFGQTHTNFGGGAGVATTSGKNQTVVVSSRAITDRNELFSLNDRENTLSPSASMRSSSGSNHKRGKSSSGDMGVIGMATGGHDSSDDSQRILSEPGKIWRTNEVKLEYSDLEEGDYDMNGKVWMGKGPKNGGNGPGYNGQSGPGMI